MKHCIFVLMLSGVIASVCLAQEPLRGPDGGTSTHVSGVELLNIPGVPFSGKSNIEWTRTLEDGSTITTHLQASLARDSKGRVYRERCSFVPANVDPTSHLNEVHIYDPIARAQMICSLRAMQCVIYDYAPHTFYETRPEGSFASDTRYLTRENLGNDTLEGLFVTGTRETKTVNPDAVGNDRALKSTREFWYNADLQTNLKVIRIEPATGKQVIWLTNLSLTEPNPELFKVPIGYSVRDARMNAHAKH